MERVVKLLREVVQRLDGIDDKLCKLAMRDVSSREKNALRRQYYRERKERAFADKLTLPAFPIFSRKDPRLVPKYRGWAEVGLAFGKEDKPAEFLRWLVWNWNSGTYVKKPVTFSGSAFMIWNGHCRHGYGPGDFLHLYRKRMLMTPFLRNEGERDDFSDRPFWRWGTYVLYPIVCLMKADPAWETFSERFRTVVQIICGGFVELEVGDCNWDFHESRENINKMMKRIAHLWKPLLEAVVTGFRASECPPVPNSVNQKK